VAPDERQLAEIARRHQLDLVLLFGSAATDSMHGHSDVDIAVRRRAGTLAMEERARLESELSRLFDGQRVDLVLIEHPDPLFLKQITDHARLLYGSERDLAELRILAFRRYQDHRRFLEMERAYVDRFVSAAR
jgi:predicted nucleotidyltransferase